MKKSDFEMLSNEELEYVLSDSSSYSGMEIAYVQETLAKRKGITYEKIITNDTENTDYIPGIKEGIYDKNRDVMLNIERDTHIIRNCIIFFTIITLLSMVILLISGISMAVNISKLGL